MAPNSWDFSGAGVVVTGAARGIGFAIAEGFVRSRARVHLVDVDERNLADAVTRLRDGVPDAQTSSAACDLSDARAIRELAATCTAALGGIDVLVNNAGIGREESLPTSTDEYIDAVLGVNLRAVLVLTRELLPSLTRKEGGAIINIASQAAKNGQPNLSVYSASKAGVLGLTIALARELVPTVRVNAVCPGHVATDMMKANIEQTTREQGISYDEAYAQWVTPIPTRRFQEPADVANAVMFLASHAAKEITGEALNVSGGLVTW